MTHFTVAGGPEGIVLGSDGAFWFTESTGNGIGRITTAGVFTGDYPIPSANTLPQTIAAGPDGALWFTEFSDNRIGRITTAGVVTEYPTPTATSGPSGIVAGPDGNLWFTESNASKIGRLTPAGAFTEFPLPSTTRCFDISAGPDGALWFTEYDNNRIGRITTSGGIVEFLIPTADSGPYGITSGPDGNLWFTQFRAYKIGTVAPPAPIPGASLYTLTPCRVSDTRNPDGPYGGPALVANTERFLTLAGRCGIPSGIRAVVANVTVTQGTAAGSLSLFPAGSTPGATTTASYGAGQTRANNAVLSIGTDDAVFIRCAQPFGTVHLIVDVSGYFR